MASINTEFQGCVRSTEGWQCRAGNTCDYAEYCSGGFCPPDSRVPAGTSCNDGNPGTSGDVCDGSGGCAGEAPSNCPSTTVSWSQWQPAWNNNPRTQGTYLCSGTLSATPHGSRATASQVRGTTPELFRTGSVQYTCNNGSWQLVAGSETCDGLPYSTYHVTCAYGSDPARDMFLGFYMNDLKRCADLGGLDWWTSQYNNDCLAPDYKGLGSKEACFRVEFLRGPEDDEVQANGGHITSTAERNQCGVEAGGGSWRT
jgi:hypothetical protein